MKTVSIIRERGQLTIPDSIRRLIGWVSPMSAVTISVVKPDEIVITPHRVQINWDEIWEGIKQSRAIHGKGNLSTSEFLAKDRLAH